MKLHFIVILGMLLNAGISKAQEKKHYHIMPIDEQQLVKLHVNASSVSCRINSTHNMHAVSVYGYPENDAFDPITVNHVRQGKRIVKLNFEDKSEDFTSSISGRMFSGLDNNTENPWHVYLSRSTPFDLNLRYGMGNSAVDLSGLAVQQFKINTGSADVKVGYFANVPNKIEMDTFYAKVDLGVLELDQLNLSHAQEILADVGFGKIQMRFAEKSGQQCLINASVGAGSLDVLLENPEIPVIVHINDSPLCRIKMREFFTEIQPNVYVNDSYQENDAELITFRIDVAMGNVTFRMPE